MAVSVPRRRVVAVFGVGSAKRGSRRSESARAHRVLERIYDAVHAHASQIARPLLDAGVRAGTITQAQEDSFLARLSQQLPPGSAGQPAAGSRLSLDGGALPTVDQRQLLASVFAAIRGQTAAIATPLLDEAVADGTITQTEAERISARLAEVARRSPTRPGVGGSRDRALVLAA